ncbi:nuclear transport factor 2 family protein [Corynebacterium falsenii]|uniref:Nuclear transport factor 2 family protein n=1 Tax=Corynebacterium falsenii TaxID=108486 RepID=A0A418Q7P3_9CORY|nr:nuclear transport factor 2 family protein [Corynebacterium falsenii]AHI04268.1 hypothetical protein CFAL_04575 [Corynebacterium falsenii DSM 44353]MDC7103640.1 nuclear transport factor 2 family protein [Corynebacterium falsenii]RIX35298.1 hypothetical protein D3M95_05415 [Corynebacterium falsenii]UBI03676.1 nuclear transport factor 2 family protein [Corynebacterium falsenii]UBI06316.1 nuclear transport factor 2 family protein [Corynebacterium falsenii]
MSYRKTFAAALCVLPFALTACGSDGDSGDSSASSSASSSTTTAGPSTQKSETDKTASSNDPSKDPQSPDADGAQGQKGQPGQNDQAQGGANQGQPPVPMSGSASQKDKEEITNLVLTLGQGSKNAAEFNNQLIDNSCKAYIDSKGGEEAARQSANAVQDAGSFNDIARVPKFTSVDDITVNGDQATAVVHAEQGGQSFSQKMNFTREDGRWKMCPTG